MHKKSPLMGRQSTYRRTFAHFFVYVYLVFYSFAPFKGRVTVK